MTDEEKQSLSLQADRLLLRAKEARDQAKESMNIDQNMGYFYLGMEQGYTRSAAALCLWIDSVEKTP